jgi:hypothetical protein
MKSILIGALTTLAFVAGQDQNIGNDNILRQRRKVIRVEELSKQSKESLVTNMYGEKENLSRNRRNTIVEEKDSMYNKAEFARNIIPLRNVLTTEQGWNFDRFLFESSLSMSMSMSLSM